MERLELGRPAVLVGFTYAASLLAAAFIGAQLTPYITVFLLLTIGLMFVFRLHRKHFPSVLALAVSAAALTVFTAASWFSVLPAQRYVDNAYTIDGVIESEAEHRYGNYYYKVRVKHIEEPEQDVDFQIRLSHGEALGGGVGDTLRCTVKFTAFQDAFGLSSRTAQLAQGNVLAAYITDYEHISVAPAAKKPIAYFGSRIRADIRDRLLRAYPKEEGSVLCVMLLGLRNDISDELSNAYRSAGASHILVISGMHMAIVAQFALGAFGLLGIRRRYAAGLSIVFVLAFMVVSGMSATVVRSGIMQILLLLGLLIGRQADRLNSLAVAILCLALANPFCVGDISLLLSFSATLGIIVFSPCFSELVSAKIKDHKRQRFVSALLSPLFASVSAILGTLPVQLYAFGTVNFCSILTSLLVLYASAWLIRFGVLAAICLYVPFLTPAAAPFVFLSGLLAKYQNFVVKLLAGQLPGTIELSGAYLTAAVLLTLLFLALAKLIFGKRRLDPAVYVLSACILFSGMGANAYLNENRTRLLVLDSEYAQCTALIQDSRADILTCSGNGSEAAKMLREYGAKRIGLLHVPKDESGIRCAETLAEEFSVAALLTPDSVYLSPENIPRTVYEYGCTGQTPGGTPLTVSENGKLMRLTVCGKTIVLTGGGGYRDAQYADILIADAPQSAIRAPLTILKTDQTMKNTAQDLSAGSYILTSEHEAVCLDFDADGRYTILGQ